MVRAWGACFDTQEPSCQVSATGCVRVAVDRGCERIHKKRKMQRAKFYSPSEIRKGLDVGKCSSTERLVQ